MLKTLAISLITGLLITACNVKTKIEVTDSEEELELQKEEVMDLLQDWTKAYLNRDTATLNRVIGDDWYYSGSSDGSLVNKKQAIEDFAQATYTVQSIEYQGIDVRLFGKTAIITGSELMIIHDIDSTIQYHRQFTDVYVKRDNHWEAVATHTSPID